MDIEDVYDKYVSWVQACYGKDAGQQVAVDLRFFLHQFGHIDARLIDLLHIDLHVATAVKLNQKPETIAREVKAIHEMCSRAVQEGWIESRLYPHKCFIVTIGL